MDQGTGTVLPMTPETPREAGRQETADELDRRRVSAGICDEYNSCERLQDIAAEAIAALRAAPATGLPAAEGLREAAQRREDAEEAVADYEAALHEAWSETGEQPSDEQEEQRGRLANELGEAILAVRAALAAADRAERGLPLPAGHPDTWPGGTMHMPAERGLPLAGDDRRPDVAPDDDLRTAHADSTRLPLSLSASGEASVPAIVAADAGEPLRVWAGMDAEWKRLRRIEAAARDLDNLAPMWPESAHSDWSPDGIAAIGELRAALAADPQSPTGEG